MSELNPNFKEPGIGDFIKCFFPHFAKDPSSPSRNEHCAMIVDIGYDKELGLKTYTLVHASREYENDLMLASDFKPLAQEITGRVQVSPTTERTINHDIVAVLPVCPVFFGDLTRHAHIRVLATTNADTVAKIRARLSEPNMTAISVYRMEEQQFTHGVTPDLFIKRRKLAQANGGTLDYDV